MKSSLRQSSTYVTLRDLMRQTKVPTNQENDDQIHRCYKNIHYLLPCALILKVNDAL